MRRTVGPFRTGPARAGRVEVGAILAGYLTGPLSAHRMRPHAPRPRVREWVRPASRRHFSVTEIVTSGMGAVNEDEAF